LTFPNSVVYYPVIWRRILLITILLGALFANRNSVCDEEVDACCAWTYQARLSNDLNDDGSCSVLDIVHLVLCVLGSYCDEYPENNY